MRILIDLLFLFATFALRLYLAFFAKDIIPTAADKNILG